MVERMTRTLANAMQRDDDKIDHVAIVCDTAAAITQLHDRGIVHSNVKPANILLNEDDRQAKLANIGTSHRPSVSANPTASTRQAETIFYMPPELRSRSRCKTTSKIDCWAFGLVICEVMNPEGFDALVGAHHGDLHDAAVDWAIGINDHEFRVAATAFL